MGIYWRKSSIYGGFFGKQCLVTREYFGIFRYSLMNDVIYVQHIRVHFLWNWSNGFIVWLMQEVFLMTFLEGVSRGDILHSLIQAESNFGGRKFGYFPATCQENQPAGSAEGQGKQSPCKACHECSLEWWTASFGGGGCGMVQVCLEFAAAHGGRISLEHWDGIP